MTASIDWDAATAEAVSLLREYLRIDTSNPPGNERPAVEFLRGILAAEGIPSEVAESAPGRSNLFARLGPSAGGVCLLNHTDVVPVERQFWARDPFSGDLVDGMVWGRGALDMKGMGILELMVFLLLRRTGVPLAESVSFLAVADEEAGKRLRRLLGRREPAGMDGHWPGDQRGRLWSRAARRPPQVFQIAPTEKVPLWVRLTVHGRPGHGSVPHGDNCAEHLVQALERITRWQRELRILPVMKEHARALTGAGVMRSAADDAILRAANRNPSLRARLSNTVAVTTINTGIKVNVIPAEATATLDCRLLPDVDADVFLAELSAVIADSRVELAIENRFVGAESPLDTRFASVVRDVIADMAEGAHIAPEMTSGFTDSRIYRLKGIPAYGFVPCLVPPEELGGVHGHNERISVENIRLGLQVLYEVVRRLVASP
ncbi:MAG: M20/M25/M40 family metallo-hydrolase [Dehalococcoidia bacterium]|nr:M20/M25/M40 family metallo-hydrolase [Dehalococcoidia bacterium]